MLPPEIYSVKVLIVNQTHGLTSHVVNTIIQKWLSNNKTLVVNDLKTTNSKTYAITDDDGIVTIEVYRNDNNIDNRNPNYVVFSLEKATGGKPRKGRFESMTVTDLKQRCAKRGIKGYSSLRKAELIAALRKRKAMDKF